MNIGPRLTTRDKLVFQFIHRNRFADFEVLKEKFWPQSTDKIHYRRLMLLRKRGYLEWVHGDLAHGEGLQLTPKAFRILKKSGATLPGKARIKPLYKTSFRHDKMLIRLREVFESSPLISGYIPEHELRVLLAKKHGTQEKRDERYKVPDALFNLRTQKGKFAVGLELELATKSSARYAKMMKQLCISDDFTVIFFVAKDLSLLETLQRQLNEVRTKDRLVRMWKYRHAFYFGVLPDLLTLKLRAPLSGEGTVLNLDDVARNLKEK